MYIVLNCAWCSNETAKANETRVNACCSNKKASGQVRLAEKYRETPLILINSARRSRVRRESNQAWFSLTFGLTSFLLVHRARQFMQFSYFTKRKALSESSMLHFKFRCDFQFTTGSSSSASVKYLTSCHFFRFFFSFFFNLCPLSLLQRWNTSLG